MAEGVLYAPSLHQAQDVAVLPDSTTMSPILSVENNPDDETLTLRALEKQGIGDHVVVARDGAEALDSLFGTGLYAGRDAAEIPRRILLDLKLPKIDGLDVLRRRCGDRRTQMIPVVILTSSNEAADRLASDRRCANSDVRKPVDVDQFFDALRPIVTDWLRLNEPPPPTRDL